MTTFKILHDTDPSNPRTDSDNLTLFVCDHSRYTMGDANARSVLYKKLGQVYSNLNLRELVQKAHDKGLIFCSVPLYMYEHSGIAISTKPFSCIFDSGQLGEVIIFNDDIKEEFGIKRITKAKREELMTFALKHIEADVEIYGNYVSGEVYSVELFDDNEDFLDSQSGFYGSDFETNGIKDFIPQELHSELENAVISYS